MAFWHVTWFHIPRENSSAQSSWISLRGPPYRRWGDEREDSAVRGRWWAIAPWLRDTGLCPPLSWVIWFIFNWSRFQRGQQWAYKTKAVVENFCKVFCIIKVNLIDGALWRVGEITQIDERIAKRAPVGKWRVPLFCCGRAVATWHPCSSSRRGPWLWPWGSRWRSEWRSAIPVFSFHPWFSFRLRVWLMSTFLSAFGGNARTREEDN